MPICERVVCQESRRGHTEETEQRAPTDATRREIRGGAGGEILEASGEFGKDARPARRARPPAAARSALDASRTPPRPGCPRGAPTPWCAVATPGERRHRRVRETRGRKSSRRAGLQTHPRRPGRCRVRRPDREGALVARCACGVTGPPGADVSGRTGTLRRVR